MAGPRKKQKKTPRAEDDDDQLDFDLLIDQNSDDESVTDDRQGNNGDNTHRNKHSATPKSNEIARKKEKRINSIIFADKHMENAPKELMFFDPLKLESDDHSLNPNKDNDNFFYELMVCERILKEIEYAKNFATLNYMYMSPKI